MNTHPLSLRSTLDNPYFLRNSEKKEVYLYLSLKAIEPAEQMARVPLNLSLVLDRSGSMAGDKLAYAKKAANYVITHLSPSDTLSIVQYDDQVEVVQEAAFLHQKEYLQQRVNRITTGGSTNLSGGMSEGFTQGRLAKREACINRVLLLSDGLANVGVTDPHVLQQVAQRTFREEGISLSTFGVGADFNEDLMTHLAEYGGGNYYFISSPDGIPAIFAQELAGLLTVVAQGVQLEVTFPDSYLWCAGVYGFPHTQEADRVVLRLGDVFAREEKGVLLKFELHHPFERAISFGLTLTYGDATAQLRPLQERQPILLQVTEQEAVWQQGVNPLVLEQVALFRGNTLLEEAIKEAENYRYEEARQKAADARAYLEGCLKDFPDSPRLKALYAQLANYEQEVNRMQDFSQTERSSSLKSFKYSSYSSRKGRLLFLLLVLAASMLMDN